MKLFKTDPKMREMITEVMKNARRQTYTPETLCQLQKILETQYFYYWSMDMKKEEYVCDLFTEDFVYSCFGEKGTAPRQQALRSKYVNRNMSTMHMCHQPLVWLMSDNTARGIFLYEDNHSYADGGNVENYAVYCDDFRKCGDGVWRINELRMCYRKMNGELRDLDVPEGWEPKHWEEWKV